MLHIKLNGITNAATWSLTADPGVVSIGQKSTFFQNMVMLHIILKGNTNKATLKQIFCQQTQPHPGDGDNISKVNFFQNMVMLLIKLMGIRKCSNVVATWLNLHILVYVLLN